MNCVATPSQGDYSVVRSNQRFPPDMKRLPKISRQSQRVGKIVQRSGGAHKNPVLKKLCPLPQNLIHNINHCILFELEEYLQKRLRD